MLFQESQFQPVLKTLFSKFSGGAFPQTPLEWSKKFFAPLRGSNFFLARNFTLNYYNNLANMYCNRFSIILYIISDNSLINPNEEWYNHEILVCKNITESFTSFVLCFLNVLFIVQATLVLIFGSSVGSDPWTPSKGLPWGPYSTPRPAAGKGNDLCMLAPHRYKPNKLLVVVVVVVV